MFFLTHKKQSDTTRETCAFAEAIPLRLGLLCVFSGVWISDALAASCFGAEGTLPATRVASLCAYVLAFAGVVLWHKRHDAAQETGADQSSTRPKFRALCAVSATAFLCCIAGMLALVWGSQGAAALTAIAATKLVGAPLTIALAYGFAQAEQSRVEHDALFGIAGAFALSTATHEAMIAGFINTAAMLLVAACLIGIAAVCAMQAMRTTLEHPRNAAQDAQHVEHERQPELPSALRAFSAPFIVLITATASMLGFLHTSTWETELVCAPVVVGIFIALALFGLLRTTRIRLFDTLMLGLACVAAGFIIEPLIGAAPFDTQAVVVSFGGVLLEAVAWMLTVFAVPGRTPFRNAAAARLLVVIGHLIGMLMATALPTVASTNTGVIQGGGLVLVFAYFVIALFLARNTAEDGAHKNLGSAQEKPAQGESTKGETPYDKAYSHRNDAAKSIDTLHCAVNDIAQEAGLTPRELDTFALLAQGRDIAFIEQELVISRNTAKMHIKNVYRKTNVHSKQELIGLVQEHEEGALKG